MAPGIETWISRMLTEKRSVSDKTSRFTWGANNARANGPYGRRGRTSPNGDGGDADGGEPIVAVGFFAFD